MKVLSRPHDTPSKTAKVMVRHPIKAIKPIVVNTCTRDGTCVHDPLYLDAGVVQLLGKGVHGLQQVLARLWVNVGPPCGDLN